MPQDKTIYLSRNPEDEHDVTWFASEDAAYQDWREYGDTYLYTAFNEAEGRAYPLNDEFADRVVPDAFDVAASRADALHQARMEGVA